VGTKSYDVHEALFLEGKDTPVFQSIHTFVMFNFKEQTSIPVDDVIRANLKEIE
jgi:acyl-CoA thioester hydrolase